MAVDVVNFLESIEIEVQQGASMAVPSRLRDLLFEPVFEQLTVRQAGEFVEMRLPVQCFFALGAGKGYGETTCEIDTATHAVFFHVESRRRTQQENSLEIVLEHHRNQNNARCAITEESSLVWSDRRTDILNRHLARLTPVVPELHGQRDTLMYEVRAVSGDHLRPMRCIGITGNNAGGFAARQVDQMFDDTL